MRPKDISILRTLFFAHLPRRSRLYYRRGSFVIHLSWYSNKWNAHYTFSYWCCCFLCAPVYVSAARAGYILCRGKVRKKKRRCVCRRVPTRSRSPPPPSLLFRLCDYYSPAVHIQLTAQPVLLSIYDNDGQCYNSVALLLYIGYTYIFAIAAGRDGDHRVYPSRCNNNPPVKKKKNYTIT